MLHWKNKPIDSLSKSELQEALQDALPIMMGTQSADTAVDNLSAFVIGAFTGMGITGLCFGVVAVLI